MDWSLASTVVAIGGGVVTAAWTITQFTHTMSRHRAYERWLAVAESLPESDEAARSYATDAYRSALVGIVAARRTRSTRVTAFVLGTIGFIALFFVLLSASWLEQAARNWLISIVPSLVLMSPFIFATEVLDSARRRAWAEFGWPIPGEAERQRQVAKLTARWAERRQQRVARKSLRRQHQIAPTPDD